MFIVRALADGHVLAKGPMSKNKHQELGPCASLELDGILIAVSSGKAQMFDRELFRHVGIQPEEMKILVNKSSVHFRADFAPIADRIFVAKAKGPVAADPTDLKWQHLRSDMQLMP
jgi:microcystin degradation protein MlrC